MPQSQLALFNQIQATAFATCDVFELIHKRSDFLDNLLMQLWQEKGLDQNPNLALIAVGGYGRREMFPLSDLDILILCQAPLDEATHAKINLILTRLWDVKLQVGSSIRTVEECLEVGRAEISVATNMFEGRYLAGNRPLWEDLQAQLYQPDFWPIEDFFQAKMAEKAERYARYHNTSYNLEPDLKHSPGGLRDLHLLMWIMLRHYGIHSLQALFEQGILFEEEYEELKAAEATLFKMRFGLHLQLKRYDNRLRFDRQLQLAEDLGFGQGNQAVEAMMRGYFHATQSISQLSQLLLNHFEQNVLKVVGWASLPTDLTDNFMVGRDAHPTAEESLFERGEEVSYFYLQDGLIFCRENDIFQKDPSTILDLFLHLTAQPQAKASTQTLRQLRLAVQLLERPLCDYPQARERFVLLFTQPQMVARAIVPMHQLGVLEAYFPAWQGITGLMQFDMFHLYTVDEHSVRVMLKLESFLDPANQAQHPLCCQLFPQIADRSLIYFAALLHDIAKGREGDHAQNGAVEMYDFAKLHGFNEEQASFMAWLVAEHLTMSITAQRRDIFDPAIVGEFANIVGEPTALNALTCLTVADICATNETLWNDWKRSLLAQLHQFTLEKLRMGEKKALDYQALATTNRLQASEHLKLILSSKQWQAAQAFWATCPPSYFARNNAKQLEWHLLGLLKTGKPSVLVGNQTQTATEIFIHCADQPQLFARVAQVLSQKKVSIHHAQIITSKEGLVFDSFIVTDLKGKPLSPDRCQQIQQALLKTLQDDKAKTFKPHKKPIKYQTFNRSTRVRFLNHHRADQTAFELFTLDREGLLAQVSYIFNELGLNLLNAKISTIGERVEDYFVVSNQEKTALTDQQQAVLKERLLAEF
ncbi:protein-P-II uridylyltransferase [Pasteurellaceae bacterium RH1A]|nr:protein-P-II uridylyltransferase [Pasteurellaceae bacterium RH1A]